MEKASIILYVSQYQAIKDLPNEEKGLLLKESSNVEVLEFCKARKEA